MAEKLTDDILKDLQPKKQAYEIRDTEARGLIIRMQPTGVATFFFQYRTVKGKTARLKIGRYGDIGLPAARKRAKTEKAKITLGGDPVAEKKEDQAALTLRQFIDDKYAPWARANLKSHVPTLYRVRYGFVPLLDKRLVDLTPFDFEANRVRRLKGKDGKAPKPSTVNRDQMTLRAALTKAVDWGLLAANPLDKVKRSREDRNTTIRALTAEEEAALLAAIEEQRASHPTDWYLPAMFVVSLDTGMRRGEVLALEWADVDIEGRTLKVKGSHRKSSQSGTIPLTARACAALKAWSKVSDTSGHVFPNATKDSLRSQWKTLKTKAGVQVRWHDLRHSYASRLAHAGAGVLMIKSLLGHASIATSQRYMHAVEADLHRAVELLEAAEKKNIVALKKKKGKQ